MKNGGWYKKIMIRNVFLCLLIVVLLYSALFCMRYQHTSSKRLAERWRGDVIAQYHSPLDKDGDGMDDQVDILKGAINYVNTHPKYKSAYYAGGYPNDVYGVCTDVVAYALKEAGYDLMELVSNDIEIHGDMYDIEIPDQNIDFRRVKNLYVFFNLNAESLTTDISKISEWQGGDIVIFKNHIAIVSDRRNQHGVPYVIHHANPFQKTYEEDILEKHDDIRGHYRWNNG